MAAEERARSVTKWGLPPQGAADPPPDPILEVFRIDFDAFLDPLGHPLGRFWETFLASCLVFCCFWESEAPSLSETRARAATLVS